MLIAVASDHGGFALKETVKEYLRQRGEVILPPIFFQKLADPPLTTP